MFPIEERVEQVEERIDHLDAIFGQFMARTEMLVREMRRNLEQHRQEAEKDRAEWRTHIGQVEGQAEKDRGEWWTRAERFEQQAEKDRAESQARAERFEQQAEKDRAESQARAERFEQQAEKDRAESKQERRELARQLGDISNRLGTLVEDMIAPSLRRIAREELGCGDELFFGPRVTKTRPDGSGRRCEFDALYVGSRAVLLNESKAVVRPEYATAFAEFLKSGEFFEYFPDYRDKPIVPVFSSLYLPEDIVTCLTKQGIYAVGMGEETMEVLNKEQISKP